MNGIWYTIDKNGIVQDAYAYEQVKVSYEYQCFMVEEDGLFYYLNWELKPISVCIIS